ncbi:MAG: hypothetical protein GBAus27B_000064 [Mycoplasmataceae bacterium]|nr:MAG: hypothetical protein GBAus27B_000064 [Mycoplasmataceae bacterium]
MRNLTKHKEWMKQRTKWHILTERESIANNQLELEVKINAWLSLADSQKQLLQIANHDNYLGSLIISKTISISGGESGLIENYSNNYSIVNHRNIGVIGDNSEGRINEFSGKFIHFTGGINNDGSFLRFSRS